MPTPSKDVKAEEPVEENLVETQEEETSIPETSAEENQTDLEEDLETSETSEKMKKPTEEEEFTEEERKKLSVKAQKRFADLSKKAKRADELEKEVERLHQAQGNAFIAGLRPETEAVSQIPTIPGRLPWETDLEQGQPVEISPEDYKRDVITTADGIVRARIGLVEKANEIRSDLNDVQKKYDVLNPQSDKYDEKFSIKLAGLFQNQLKANPNVKLSDFVDTIMEVRQGGREEGTAEATATLAEQKAEEALTPSEPEIESIEKPFEKMNLEEQEKYLKDHGLWE